MSPRRSTFPRGSHTPPSALPPEGVDRGTYGGHAVLDVLKLDEELIFRSMTPDSDKHHGPLQASPNDHRVTRVGRLLRATGMDELPQFINILKGDMSFVGPRALLPEEIEINKDSILVPIEDIPGYEVRHRVTPGLTGLAQIYARRDIPR